MPEIHPMLYIHRRRLFNHARKLLVATFLDVFENHMCGPRDYLRLRLEEVLRELQTHRVMYRWETDVTDVGSRRELKRATVKIWLDEQGSEPVTLFLEPTT